MKLTGQTIIAIVLVIVFAVVGAIIVTGGKINIPGISQNMAEVTVEVERPFFSGAVPDRVEIIDVKLYSGLPLDSIGPFLFEVNWRVEVTASYGGQILGRSSKVITISWWQKQTHIFNVPLGDRVSGILLTAKVFDTEGQLVLTDTYTIT